MFDAAAHASFELAARYDQPKTTYPSEPDPTLVPAFKPYAHLAVVANGKPAAMTTDLTAEMAQHQSAAHAMTAAATAANYAADPQASVFVSANAGTGKTKLLTDRCCGCCCPGRPPTVSCA